MNVALQWKKPNVMLFNTAIKTDFLPLIEISDSNQIEVVKEMKLLGIMIRSHLKWSSNTQNLVKKVS